jgi:diguanylate cyclase (GGDEF)-like protein
MTSSDTATQQLAEFLAVLTATVDEQAAIANALERLAESFDAEAGAFVRDGQVAASLGWAVGYRPEAELREVAAGCRTTIDLPGVGPCETVVVPVGPDDRTSIILARPGSRFTAEEVGLLRGMSRVLALGLRLLATVAVERSQADENAKMVVSLRQQQALLEKQSSARRQIAQRAPIGKVLGTITADAAELLGEGVVVLQLIDDGDPDFMETVSNAGTPGLLDGDYCRVPRAQGIGGQAIRDDRLCTLEAAAGLPGQDHVHWAMAAPVHVEGRPAGALIVASAQFGRGYQIHERDILTAFAELAGLALNDDRTVRAMKGALDDARHQAMHDELTDLPNRACFYDRTEQALRLAARDGGHAAVLLLDLNRFKEINDTLGHKYGDRVLREIGPRLRQGLRHSDTLARLGGDEFCVLLPRVEGPLEAIDVAQRLLALLEDPFEIDGMGMSVEASCGVAVSPDDGDSADLLLQRADVAMYVAKGTRSGVVAYNDELNINSRARLALLGELRTAVAQGQFVLYYQPKATLDGNRVEGVEALVRWEHPTLGLVPPNDFIPLAEHTGLIKPLTTWVLGTALEQLSRWRQGGPAGSVPDDLTMAVNLSTRSLLDDGFPGEVVAALRRWDIPAPLLELEITESTIMADPSRAHRLLSELAAIGVRVAIDDFGTGYSSLSYLKHLPVTQLKIDRSFVINMNHDHNDAVIVRSVIDLGHNLGLHTVAEGIEDGATWEQLKALGCDSGQGYLLARPMPADRLVAWLNESSAKPA